MEPEVTPGSLRKRSCFTLALVDKRCFSQSPWACERSASLTLYPSTCIKFRSDCWWWTTIRHLTGWNHSLGDSKSFSRSDPKTPLEDDPDQQKHERTTWTYQVFKLEFYPRHFVLCHKLFLLFSQECQEGFAKYTMLEKRSSACSWFFPFEDCE